MKKFEVTVRRNNITTKVQSLAKHGIDAACNVLHLLGDLEGKSFRVSVKALTEVAK